MSLSDIWTYLSKFFNSENKEKLVYFVVNIFFAVIIFLIFYTIARIALNKIQYVKSDKEPTEKRELRNLEIPSPSQGDDRNFSQLYRNFIANFVFYVIILIGYFRKHWYRNCFRIPESHSTNYFWYYYSTIPILQFRRFS